LLTAYHLPLTARRSPRLWLYDEYLQPRPPKRVPVHAAEINAGQRLGAGVRRELVARMGGGDADDRHAGRAGGLDAGGGVLDDEAGRRQHAELPGGEEVGVGTRLGPCDILG